jgi:quinol monooxygenase YgiN
MIEPSRDEPGCLGYHPLTDPNDPARLVLIEEWTGPEALAEHLTTAHHHQLTRVLDDVLAEPVTIRKFFPAPPD